MNINRQNPSRILFEIDNSMNGIVSFKPVDSLLPYVSGYFYSNFNFDRFDKQFFTPKGTAALFIPLDIDPGSYIGYPDDSNRIFFENFVPYLFGQMTRIGNSSLIHRFENFVIIFKPYGLFHFLGGPASQMTDRIVRLDQMGLPELHQKMTHVFKSSSEVSNWVPQVDRILIDHFHSAPIKKVSEFIPVVINQVHLGKGVINLEEIVNQLGINNRTFQIHFKDQIGISPKLFCRITRFNSLLEVLDSMPSDDLLGFAIQFGYTDNPHLYKDFKEFTGLTPKKYMRLRSNFNALIEREVKKGLSI